MNPAERIQLEKMIQVNGAVDDGKHVLDNFGLIISRFFL